MNLELKFLPLFVVLISALLMWLLDRLVSPGFEFDHDLRWALAIALYIVGIILVFAGAVAFRRAKTTVNPIRPGTASSLVVSGIYRYTRNPMYLGFLVCLIGWAVALANIFCLILATGFIPYMNRFQIKPEEAALQSRFGDDFATYKKKVRRWL